MPGVRQRGLCAMDQDPNRSQRTALTALALVGQLGLAVALPMVIGGIAGKYLDEWVDGHGIVLILMLILGIASGLYSAYRILAKELRWTP